ncbi:hypothetical protein GCM10027271_53780 [Saccharopolyspora gloriosae]|uniref:Uncharacterized protein n=1 Tax=Saccharopolyspora gloriosae TaxID=455344 RepID=A0A840NKH4_9PSEU|nr:hypothetical protein [Saccharopolyspora gloriosae]MBB5068757.1 hypothetical protein [Saccharopolyspora gloriosae]
MSNESHQPGTARALAQRISMPVFKVCLVVFLVLGVALVLVQAVGIVIGNAALVSGAVDLLGAPTTIAAGVTGLLGFAMSYVFPWTSGED